MKQILVVVMFILSFCACEKCEKRIIPLHIEKKIEQVNLAIKGEVGFDIVQALSDELNGISNRVIRIACYNKWTDELMALDISDIGYYQQSRAIHDMWELVHGKISGGLRLSKLSVVDVWDVKLRVLAWQRKQLERLKPIGPLPKGLEVTKGGVLNVLDLKVNAKYSDWLSCYKSAASNYESQIRHMEGHTFYVDTLRSTEEEKEKLREMLRKYIGRPIRSEEELRRDAKNNTAMEFPYAGWFIGKGPLKF